MANQLLRFAAGTRGLAQYLAEREVGDVVLGEFSAIAEAQDAYSPGEVLSIPAGGRCRGRVVDPLGRPGDGLGDIETVGRRELELQAAGVMDRQEVREPLQTGYKSIDAMIPIGRGQRQLVIGDRKTGKTAL